MQMVYFSDEGDVAHLLESHIHGEFLLASMSEVVPIFCHHLFVVGFLDEGVYWRYFNFSSYPHCSFDFGVVVGIFDIVGYYGLRVFSCYVVGVADVNGVMPFSFVWDE